MSSQQSDAAPEVQPVDAPKAAVAAEADAPQPTNGKAPAAAAAAGVDEESRDSTVQSQSGEEDEHDDEEGEEHDDEEGDDDDEDDEPEEGHKNGKHAAEAETNGAAKGHKRPSNGNDVEAAVESDSPSKKKAKADENATPAEATAE